MSNSIDINLREDNSMNSLSFFWKARFKDESEIFQFNIDGSSNPFQLIRDRFADLSYFYLISKDKLQCFTVDLLHGLIFYNNHQSIQPELIEKKKNIRLIYFRRVKKIISQQDLKIKSTIITYFLGLQYNIANNENRKIFLQIDAEGNFIVIGE